MTSSSTPRLSDARLTQGEPSGHSAKADPVEVAESSVEPDLGIAELTHELRTPLQAALLAAELLEGDNHNVNVLKSALGHMGSLLDREHNLYRRITQYSIRVTTSEAVSLADSNHRVVVDDRLGDDRSLTGDPTVLRQIVVILLSNALKYSPSDSRVLVDLFSRDGATVVSVRDNGPGVPPSEQSKIFMSGWRAEGHQVNGSGLGLGIARRLAREIGADLTLTESSSSGSVFEIEVTHTQATPKVVT